MVLSSASSPSLRKRIYDNTLARRDSGSVEISRKVVSSKSVIRHRTAGIRVIRGRLREGGHGSGVGVYSSANAVGTISVAVGVCVRPPWGVSEGGSVGTGVGP